MKKTYKISIIFITSLFLSINTIPSLVYANEQNGSSQTTSSSVSNIVVNDVIDQNTNIVKEATIQDNISNTITEITSLYQFPFLFFLYSCYLQFQL